MNYLEVYYTSKYFYTLKYPDVFIFVISNSIVNREHASYNLKPFKFIKICFVPIIWFILLSVLCALENNVYSAIVG